MAEFGRGGRSHNVRSLSFSAIARQREIGRRWSRHKSRQEGRPAVPLLELQEELRDALRLEGPS